MKFSVLVCLLFVSYMAHAIATDYTLIENYNYPNQRTVAKITIFTEVETLTTNPTHYGDPTGGCMSDELPARIQGVEGDVCLPKCESDNSCPTDLPAGATAKPNCALQTSTGDKYCALFCKGLLGSGDCGTGAKCETLQFVFGVCMYEDSDISPVSILL